MGTHPIFESDFDCLTERPKSSGMNKRILQSVGTSACHQSRPVSYRFNEKFLYDSIPVQHFDENEAKIAFNILKTNGAMPTSSLVDLFGRKADLMEHSIERFVEDRCGKKTELNFEDFYSLVQNKEDAELVSISDVFTVFDVDGNEEISIDEIREWMMRHGKLMSLTQIQEGIESSDKNHDGVIDKREFIQIVTKKIIFNQLIENNYA